MECNWLLPKQQTLREQLGSETDLGLNDVVAYLRNLPSVAVDYFTGVFNLVKFNTSLFLPPTNAVTERSASALRRLKTGIFEQLCRKKRLNH